MSNNIHRVAIFVGHLPNDRRLSCRLFVRLDFFSCWLDFLNRRFNFLGCRCDCLINKVLSCFRRRVRQDWFGDFFLLNSGFDQLIGFRIKHRGYVRRNRC